MPTITNVLIFKSLSTSSKPVPINALLTLLVNTISSPFGITKSLNSNPGFNSCSFESGFVELCLTWITFKPSSLHFSKIFPQISSAS